MDSKDQMRTRIWKKTFSEDITPYRAPCVFFFYCSGHQHSAAPLFFFVVFAFFKFQRFPFFFFVAHQSSICSACSQRVHGGGLGISRKLFYTSTFLGLCDNSDKFPKMFCSSWGMECPSTANFCHQCGQQLNLSQVSNKTTISVDKEKLLKEYFHRGYPYAFINLLEKRHGVRMHVRMLKKEAKK